MLTDEDGYEITYAHLSSRSVSAGEQIEKGTEIGKVGSTGNSTGPHLHLELSHNGEHLNPVFYFETGDSMPNGNVEYSSEAAKRLVEIWLAVSGRAICVGEGVSLLRDLTAQVLSVTV